MVVIVGLALWLGVFRRQAKPALIMATVASVMVGMWIVRNYVVFDRIVFVSTNSGDMLILGNSENSTPNSGPTTDVNQYTSLANQMDEVSRDRYLQARAWDYIRAHPARSLELYLLKVVNYFNYRNDLVTASEASSLKDLVMLLTYAPLLIVFVIRLVSFRWVKPLAFEVLFIAIYLCNAFYTAIFFPRIRYRLPFDFLLILIAASFIGRCLQKKIDTPSQPNPSD